MFLENTFAVAAVFALLVTALAVPLPAENLHGLQSSIPASGDIKGVEDFRPQVRQVLSDPENIQSVGKDIAPYLQGLYDAQSKDSRKFFIGSLGNNNQIRAFEIELQQQSADVLNKVDEYTSKFGTWDSKTKKFANEDAWLKSKTGGAAVEQAPESVEKELEDAKAFMKGGRNEFLDKLYQIYTAEPPASLKDWIMKLWNKIMFWRPKVGANSAIRAVRKADQQVTNAENKKEEETMEQFKQWHAEEEAKQNANKDAKDTQGSSSAPKENKNAESPAEKDSTKLSDAEVTALVESPSSSNTGTSINLEDNSISKLNPSNNAVTSITKLLESDSSHDLDFSDNEIRQWASKDSKQAIDNALKPIVQTLLNYRNTPSKPSIFGEYSFNDKQAQNDIFNALVNAQRLESDAAFYNIDVPKVIGRAVAGGNPSLIAQAEKYIPDIKPWIEKYSGDFIAKGVLNSAAKASDEDVIDKIVDWGKFLHI